MPVFIPSPEKLEKDPNALKPKRFGREGWHKVAVVRVGHFKKYDDDDKDKKTPIRETMTVEFENMEGERATAWLSDDSRDQSKWIQMYHTFKLAWADGASIGDIVKLYQGEQCVDQVCGVRVEFDKGDRCNVMEICSSKDVPDLPEDAKEEKPKGEKKLSAKERLKREAKM